MCARVSEIEWDPARYLVDIRAEIPRYDELQEEVAAATSDITAESVLELGTGTGETARRLLALHRRASLLGIDGSQAMLAAARIALPRARVRLLEARLEEPLPPGPFDLVVSALAVHHLVDAAKADLFGRIGRVLGRGGRFVLGDVVVPERPADAVIPLEPGVDLPSSVEAQLEWLREAGFRAEVFWSRQDLAVLRADLV
jgi:tRNA (cmo5U34)-methyltransferase